jgi:Caspase domain
MFRNTAVFLILIISILGSVSFAVAQQRVALVIGNSNYKLITSLPNPKNDATLMSKTLKEVGFEVITATDTDRRGMSRAVKNFGKRLRLAGKDAVGLFYYAGHGVQANGANYLVPLGAEIEDQSDLSLETLSASDILSQMESAGNALNLVILDACRNNPYKGRVRSSSSGLARLNAASGSLVAFAAAPGQVAADGTGTNSPYTKALTTAMKLPGLSIEQVFKQTRRDVEKLTGGRQTPWEESSLKGDFSFVPAEHKTAAALPPTSSIPSAANNAALEVAYWNSIQSSQEPAVFKAYLRRFPEGTFTELATLKLKKLEPKIVKLSPPKPSANRTLTPEPINPNVSEGLFSSKKELVMAIQTELNSRRCNAGSVDGAWGAQSSRAVAKFAKYAKLSLTPEPSEDLYNQIRSRPGKICPLSCGRRYEAKNNSCVLKTCTKNKTLTSSGKCVNSATRFDGSYRVTAIRTVNKKLACLPTYNMDLVVTNGTAKHKIFFGPWMLAQVKNSTLHMFSKKTRSGGRWIGTFRLSNTLGKRTSGVFKWAGDSSSCVYRVSIVKK